ncbi:MAG: hypothetical protein IPM39_01435 [Chloroflexi bacterium]|nr:hypothetical protein [Chloroflexota bacterium]
MNRKLSITLVAGLLMGIFLGGVFFGPVLGSVITFLAKTFVALFFGGALGNVALGIIIGFLGGLLIAGWATAVFRPNHASQREAKQQPTYGAL